MNLKNKAKEVIESTSVGIVMLVIFLPVRVLFVRYVSDDWFGSFGLITAVSLVILYLAKKDKMGWFGRAYHRQMYKANRGKRKYFLYFNLTLGLIFFVLTISAINIGTSDIEIMSTIKEVREQLPYENLEDVAKDAEKNMDWRDFVNAVPVFFMIIFTRFDLFVILMTTLNDLSDGWVLHFSTVFLVEELEIIGLLIYYRFAVKNKDVKSVD